MSTDILLRPYLEKDTLDPFVDSVISGASKLDINTINKLGSIDNVYKFGIDIFFLCLLTSVNRKEIYDEISTDISKYEFDTSISYRTNIENIMVTTIEKNKRNSLSIH